MGAYEKALAGLNEAQLKAVTTIDGPVLVIAGPGTGKTQLLATRIAHILATTDTLPDNILCLTFTESAAHNMRDRLSTMIGQAAYKITISTYHAFGKDLIARFPDAFSASGELDPIDDLGIDQTFRTIIGNLPFNSPLRFAESYLGDLKSFVSDVKRALLSPDDLRAIASANQNFIAAVQPLVHDALDGLARMTDKTVEPRFSKLAELLPDTMGADPSSLAVMFTRSLREALAEVAATGKKKVLTSWKDTWLVKDEHGNFIADGIKINQKLEALADVYEQYLVALRENHLFDYDDMILQAVSGLESNDDLRYTLQEQYQYILLDEFQDTNRAQLRLVELLTDNPVYEGRPNVLAVGDDDQAIYAFQGADYSHMLQFQRTYKDVVLVPLTQNYRSHREVLYLARGIAEQIEERLHHHFPSIEKILTASNPNLPKQATIERHQAQSETAQFAWVAQHIKDLISSGVPAHEIAVLAPQHKYLEPLVPYLDEAEVPVRYEKRENVLDDPIINQLIRMSQLVLMLQAGKMKEANALWCEVLSYDFWQLSTSTIWKLSWEASSDRKDWTETVLENEMLKPIALFFMRLSMLAQTETLETILDILIGSQPLDLQEPGFTTYTSPFYDSYFDKPISEANTYWDLLSNLTVLRSRVRDYRKAEHEPLHLQDFIDFVEATRSANLKILNTSPYQNGDDAIQLMTAFKAKGMEFSAVFVLAVSDEAWGTGARGQINHISLPANLRHIRYGGATPDERLRLFYVALTRAKTMLYLLNYKQTFTGKALSHLRYLNETVQDGQEISPLLPNTQQVIHPITGTAQEHASVTELASFWHQKHVSSLASQETSALLKTKIEQFQLSPTHVNSFVDLEYAGPAAFFLRTILRFPSAPSANVEFGNAMHETLEWLHKKRKEQGDLPVLQAILDEFTRRLISKRLSAQDTRQLIERGHTALRAYILQRGHTISPDNEVERNFRYDGVHIGKAHMAGTIDKLIIDKANKKITIVDYKTGGSHTRWAHTLSLHKYRHQLYLYKALVEESTTYKGYTVEDAYLEFVEPDENGNINELHLVFDEDEYQQVRKLAEAVWTSIISLQLPDVSGYSQDIKGVEKFELSLLGP